MKVIIEVIETLAEDEVIIRCSKFSEEIQSLEHYLLHQKKADASIGFFKDNQEFYFPLDEVLFFETDEDNVFAHTRQESYRIKFRLYELEKILPRKFMRTSKSSVVNLAQIYSITRNIAAASLIQFRNSNKEIYVSRHYFKALEERLSERSHYEQ